MSSPTLYTLIFKRNCCGDYDVYEQHQCQDPGCFKTDEEYVGETCLPGHIEEFVEEFQENLVEGIVDDVIVDHYIEVGR